MNVYRACVARHKDVLVWVVLAVKTFPAHVVDDLVETVVISPLNYAEWVLILFISETNVAVFVDNHWGAVHKIENGIFKSWNVWLFIENVEMNVFVGD